MGLFGKQETVTLDVTGMTCGNCVGHVTRALQGAKGVKSAAVDLEAGRAVVTGKGLDRAELVAAVAEAGYSAQ